MTTLMKDLLIQDISAEIYKMNSSEIFELNNRFCDSAHYYDSYFYDNDDEFFETYLPKSIDAVRACYFGKFEYSDNYIQFNGYGNLDSFPYLDYNHLPDNVTNIASYVADNFNEFSDLFILELDEYEKE
jgi:hypothetical protein